MKWQVENKALQCNDIWLQEEETFIPLQVNGRSIDLNACNIDLLPVKVCPDKSCNQSQFLPHSFEFCPSCGNKTVKISINDHIWAAPFGTYDGCRAFGHLRWLPVRSDGSSFPLPKGGGNFSFIVNDDPGLLIALDRAHNELRVFSYCRAFSRWVNHLSIPNYQGPPWSWSVAPGPGGFAVPTDEGPVWVSFAADGSEFHPELMPKDAAVRAVGGASLSIVQGTATACIPCKENGGMFLAWRYSGTDAPWETVPIPAEAASELGDAYLGAPAQDGAGNIYWVGEKGFLSVNVNNVNKGLPGARWHTWRENHQGKPQFMPYRDRSAVLWQLTFDGGNYFYQRLSHSGLREALTVNGPHFPVGNRSFLMSEMFEEPWQEESYDYYPEKNFFVQPLLELSNGILYLGSEDIQNIQAYIDTKKNEKYVTELAFRNSNGGNEILRSGISINSPWDPEAFLFNGGLFLYVHHQNRCWFWPEAYTRG